MEVIENKNNYFYLLPVSSIMVREVEPWLIRQADAVRLFPLSTVWNT
jgi:hypothetical protein